MSFQTFNQADDMNDAASAVAPVITIDGPTASGKGTVAHRVAEALGWHVLDSGALYRISALLVHESGTDPENQAKVGALASAMNVRFSAGAILLEGRDISNDIRLEAIGNLASRIAAYPVLREALLQRQRAFRQLPGLVADGRDMGTVVFPDAPLKIFLEASVQARAERRCKQLMEKGISVNLGGLAEDMRLRDERDRGRNVAPLMAASDARVVDSSSLSIEETVAAVLDHWSGLAVRDQA